MIAALAFPLGCLLTALTRPAKLGPWLPVDLLIVAFGGAFATCSAALACLCLEAVR